MSLDKSNAIDYLENLYLELDKKVTEKGYSGWDPRQLWKLPLAKRFYIRKNKFNNFMRRIEVAMLRYFPFLTKSYLKINGMDEFVSPYGLALLIQSYSNAYQYFDDVVYLDKAVKASKDLEQMLVTTKNGNLGVGVPGEDSDVTNLPAGAEAALAFIQLYVVTTNHHYLKVAQLIADSFIQDHHVKKVQSGIVLDYYTNDDGMHVLNANALASTVFYRIDKLSDNSNYGYYIKNIIGYISVYLNEGRIPYAGVEDKIKNPRWETCDAYHTGFTLRGYGEVVDRDVHDDFTNYMSLFLNEKGLLKVLPEGNVTDVHGLAEYVRLFAFSLSRDERVYRFIPSIIENIEYMRCENSFYYQRGVIDNNIYMPRWGHFAMMLAIADLMIVLKGKEDPF